MKLYTGLLFNRLTVFAFVRRKGAKYYWLCRCVCGRFKVVPVHSVIAGLIKSCGCLRQVNIERSKNKINRVNEIYNIQEQMKRVGYL